MKNVVKYLFMKGVVKQIIDDISVQNLATYNHWGNQNSSGDPYIPDLGPTKHCML